jgi:TonB family protein
MNSKTVILLAAMLAAAPGCKPKKAKWAGAAAGDLEAFGKPADLGIGEDVYAALALDMQGKYLLYALVRDPKEGWGFNHGLELYSYNMEINIKLPLGKLGRSDLFGFVMLGGKPMIAVARTMDTNDDGEVDEKDGNPLWVMAPDGLDEEPVSPVKEHTTGFWADPKGQLVVFSTARYWEGKQLPPPKEGEKPQEPDWSGPAYTWNFETKETSKIADCLRFYGISPDGEELACLPPDGVGEGGIEVLLASRDLSTRKKVKLPTDVDAEVVPLGGGRLAFTKVEASSTGDRRTLFIMADGKETRVTSASVETTILEPLADGGILFASRAQYTVDDGTVIRAIDGKGAKVLDLLRVTGETEIELPAITGDGKILAYAVFDESTFEATPKAVILKAVADGKAKSTPAAQIAEERIPGLGETIVDGLLKALGDSSPVRKDGITVSVPMKRAVLPLEVEGEASDDSLMKAALSVRDSVTPVLAREGYTAVLTLEGLEDAVAVFKWHEEFQKHLTYLVAYNSWVPVMDEYDLIVTDLAYDKLPGCADPRMVQLHCSGWIAAVGQVGDGNLEILCRATPLDPNMKIREGKEKISGVLPGAEAVPFDAMADKVDPRRSHRSHFRMLIFSNGSQVPYYDASWAEATKAWIATLRAIPATKALPTEKLEPFALGEENQLPLAKWFPSTVVSQEQHLDVHLFIDEDGTPEIEDKQAWDALATTAMDYFTPFLEEYDPANVDRIRISLYKGQLLMSEMWHKTAEEQAIEGCDMGEADACYQLGLIMKAKDKKIAAEMAFYDACDLGSEEACIEISGAGAAPEGGAKPAPATKPEEEQPLKKQAALPPETETEPVKAPSLKKSEIQEAIRANLKEVTYCFQKEPASSQMTVTVGILIDPKGVVESATIKNSNVAKSVEECVAQAVRRIKFPEPPDGQPIKISYPFTYVP